jgi:hypothetical protein
MIQTTYGAPRGAQQLRHDAAGLANLIEKQVDRIPSDIFLWAALGSMGAALFLQLSGNKEKAFEVGQWSGAVLILGLYNKIFKEAQPERRSSAL